MTLLEQQDPWSAENPVVDNSIERLEDRYEQESGPTFLTVTAGESLASLRECLEVLKTCQEALGEEVLPDRLKNVVLRTLAQMEMDHKTMKSELRSRDKAFIKKALKWLAQTEEGEVTSLREDLESGEVTAEMLCESLALMTGARNVEDGRDFMPSKIEEVEKVLLLLMDYGKDTRYSREEYNIVKALVAGDGWNHAVTLNVESEEPLSLREEDLQNKGFVDEVRLMTQRELSDELR